MGRLRLGLIFESLEERSSVLLATASGSRVGGFFHRGSFCCILGEAGDVDRRNGGATAAQQCLESAAAGRERAPAAAR